MYVSRISAERISVIADHNATSPVIVGVNRKGQVLSVGVAELNSLLVSEEESEEREEEEEEEEEEEYTGHTNYAFLYEYDTEDKDSVN